MTTRPWLIPIITLITLILLPLFLFAIAVAVTYPTLPSLEALTDYHPKVPLSIYSAEGILIGEFGEERRALVKIANVPQVMKDAILAAEDDKFYQHGGVDYMGVIRAALSNFTPGGVKQGASTITMQVARNFFLTREKTFTRKFNEMLLAFKIEHSLNKDDILQLYINQIYLGQRAYGFASASQTYFGKPLNQLSIAEAAMLAGLPKAPSSYNPVVNPKRAKLRQLYVLRRMNALHFITDKEFTAAGVEPIVIRRASQIFPVKADYFIEMVRQEIFQKYQDATYTQGLKVYTTLRLKDQQAAYLSLRKGVLDYDHRHGYRGPEGFTDLKKNNNDEALEEVLQDATDNDDLLPAVVLSANSHEVQAYCKGGERVTISDEGLRFAHRSLTDKAALNQRIIAGSIIRVQKTDQDTWQISQLPQVEAAFVSGDPQTGAIYSMVGGFDYNQNKFNHVTQAWRQPGSSFKPFLYSASLEKGFTPATIINDAPLSFGSDQTGSDPWQPKNYDGKYDGPMRMREALIHSKNMVSIRILQSITPQYAQEYISKFGLDKDKIPPYLTMALGAGSVTALQMLTGYSVFANGGFRVEPYYIQHVEDANGKVLSQTAPITTETGAPSVIDVRNAYTMVSMMQDVVKHGTGFRAMQLGRQDLAGKTGTTNDSIDAWFCGFQPTVVGIAWIGFDQPRSLGDKETGGGAALPIWMGYMGKVLQGIPEAKYTMPDGMVALRINDQGHRDENGKRTEYFYKENLPQTQDTTTIPGADIPLEGSKDAIKDQLL